MTFLSRLLLPTTAVSLCFAAAPASFAQSLATAANPAARSGSPLPEAPTPHLTVAALDLDAVTPLDSVAASGLAFSSSTHSDQQTTPQPPAAGEQKTPSSEEELQRELHQRMGGIVPNFNAVLDGSNVRLTPGQKMRAAFKSATDPYQFGLAAFTSGIGQAENSHTTFNPVPGTNPTLYTQAGFGQGWAGYGKRIGSSYTDQFDGTILGNGVFPILFHQDSRYYRMATGPFKKRFLYAIGTAVYCKGDNGKWQPNFSNILGNIAAGGISNIYYPAADRGFGLTIEQGMLVTAEGSFGALLIEFFPDIQRHFHHAPKMSSVAPTTQQ